MRHPKFDPIDALKAKICRSRKIGEICCVEQILGTLGKTVMFKFGPPEPLKWPFLGPLGPGITNNIAINPQLKSPGYPPSLLMRKQLFFVPLFFARIFQLFKFHFFAFPLRPEPCTQCFPCPAICLYALTLPPLYPPMFHVVFV